MSNERAGSRPRAFWGALAVLLGLCAAPAAAEQPSFDEIYAAPFVTARRETPAVFPQPAGRPVTLAGWRDRLREQARRGRDHDRRDHDRRDRDHGYERGYGYGQRRLFCSGTDHGWEEHWRPHGGWGVSADEACRICQAEHGGCDYSCSVEAYQCKAEWVPDDPNGRRETYTGRVDEDERDAEDRAVDDCRDDHWYSRDEGRCRPVSCERVTRVVESGRCRR